LGARVLSEKSARAILKWHEDHQGPYPIERLADFWTLFKRFCRDNPTARDRVTRQQVRDIHGLHRYFRNNFEHFTPKTWSIEKAGLPRIVGTAIDFIEIAMANEKVVVRLTGNMRRRLNNGLAAARAALEAS
jgi:hypothetical protein